MKKQKITNWILAIGYCIPVAFIAVLMDWANENIVFYWFMFSLMLALFFIAFVAKKTWLAMVGNVVSTAISYGLSLVFMKSETWMSYSKIYTPQGWIITISVVVLLIQILTWLLIKWIAKRKKVKASA